MIAPGQRLLHFQIEEKLGEGGMGVVWKATDTTLGRQVAIKVLPPAFSADPERLARFEREARVLASLNHPNIATVHSVHAADGDRCLTMELVPGEDLAARIARGPLPIPEALEVARQIALALEAAHEHGIVHRDLKPANVRLTPDDRVKVLDFGLARPTEGSTSTSALSQSPTLIGSIMGSGAIIGTAAYMSPEQARGQAVDRRADIWAFGVVLYEMLTGRRAFEGETVSDTLAAVLRADPDRSLLPAGLPRRIRFVLDRCLEKSPRARLRDIGEALLAIEDTIAGKPDAAAEAAAPVAGRGVSRERMLWAAAVVAALAVAAVALAWRPAKQEPPLRKLTLALSHDPDEVTATALSPDGQWLAFIADRRLWVRDLRQLTARSLAGGLDDDFRPLWSPDGAHIVFAVTGQRLARVAVASGAVSPICSVSDFTGGSGATWTADGHLLFAKGLDHIYRVAAGGGVPEVFLAKADSSEADLHHPFMLPGGRALLYVRHLNLTGPNVLAVSSPAGRRDLLRLSNGLVWDPIYDPRGYIIFTRVGDGAGLWALPFSLDRLETRGEPFLIAPAGAMPTLSTDGTLGYRVGSFQTEARVVRVNRAGAIVDTLTPMLEGPWSLALSPDEKQLAIETRVSGEGDVWLEDLERGARSRFASGPNRQGGAAWSGDGRELAWDEFGKAAIWLKPADGSRAPREVAQGHLAQFTRDGRYVVYVRESMNTATDIWYSTLDGPPNSAAVVATAAAEGFPQPSPAGRHLLYVSDESGRQEVYLRPFPDGEGRWQVSTNGAQRAVWGPKGDRIYYWAGEAIYEVPVELEPSVRLATPRLLFNLGELGMQTWGRYNLQPTSNPDRFLMLKYSETKDESATDAILVENWPAEFRTK